MKLSDLPGRAPLRAGARGGNEKIPWDEPRVSARMLREHLTQAHDRASRRFETIDRHVAWIHQTLLDGRRSSVLDLGCGPGLYTSRLARLGHTCTGIDFSPASIEHARAEAERDGLACTYRLGDLRAGGYGRDFELALLVFGELNAFGRDEARVILRSARDALGPGGMLLLEVSTRASLERERPATSWYTASSGLFSERPYVCLQESAWDTDARARIERYWVIDTGSGEVSCYVNTLHAWETDEYRALTLEAGFAEAVQHTALDGGSGTGDLMVWVARVPG